MVNVEDYVARIEGTCGEEKDVIVIFKYDKKDEVIARILKKAKTKRSISTIIFELTYDDVSFRLYGTGKAIFRSIKDKDELQRILSDLLL
jgi:ArsR family metal-binding transcriptional regulator